MPRPLSRGDLDRPRADRTPGNSSERKARGHDRSQDRLYRLPHPRLGQIRGAQPDEAVSEIAQIMAAAHRDLGGVAGKQGAAVRLDGLQ